MIAGAGGPERVGRWHVARLAGPAGAIHGREVGTEPLPAAWVVDAAARALVLGSTQSASSVDMAAAARAGVEVARRRSGGGAVLVDPAAVVWIDVILPAGDDRWRDDVGQAPLWLGEVWSAVAARFGVDAAVHRGPMPRDDLARRVCFVGRAPGEVLVGTRKLVGIAQRRTRDAARFQCACLLRWDPAALIELLAPLDDAERARVHRAALGLGATAAAVVDAFLDELATR